MTLTSLQELNLVGGTSLALQLGHRISVDIDLFGEELPDRAQFLSELDIPAEAISVEEYFYAHVIENVKVDIMKFPYALNNPILVEEGIRMASLADIAAMKIISISNRGSKKDFADFAVLLDHFSLREIFDFYETKTNKQLPVYVLKSLCYFEDAEGDAEPNMLIDLSWKEMKSKITDAVQAYYKLKG